MGNRTPDLYTKYSIVEYSTSLNGRIGSKIAESGLLFGQQHTLSY